METKVTYRINYTPEGWTVEGYGTLWNEKFPTWSEAYLAIKKFESTLA